jgi:hypothetical protein
LPEIDRPGQERVNLTLTSRRQGGKVYSGRGQRPRPNPKSEKRNPKWENEIRPSKCEISRAAEAARARTVRPAAAANSEIR